MSDTELNHSRNENTTNWSEISALDESGSLDGDREERKCLDVTKNELQDEEDFSCNSSLSEYLDKNNGSNEETSNQNQHSQTHVIPEPIPDISVFENTTVTGGNRTNIGNRNITHVGGQLIYNRFHIPQNNHIQSGTKRVSKYLNHTILINITYDHSLFYFQEQSNCEAVNKSIRRNQRKYSLIALIIIIGILFIIICLAAFISIDVDTDTPGE